MSIQYCDSGATSNDLLQSLIAEHAPVPNYQIVAQNVQVVKNVDNAPAVSMWPGPICSSPVRLTS